MPHMPSRLQAARHSAQIGPQKQFFPFAAREPSRIVAARRPRPGKMSFSPEAQRGNIGIMTLKCRIDQEIGSNHAMAPNCGNTGRGCA
jgi:hypothetical protein